MSYLEVGEGKRADRQSAIVIGCPPAYRGGTTKGTDLEINLIKYFPQTAYFVEKVSCLDVLILRE